MADTQRLHTTTVRIPDIRDAQTFCALTADYPDDVDLRQGRYVVDAKSVLGILSLNLKEPILLDIYGDAAPALLEKLAKFLCNA